jgi:predicted flap endonuclease-1-like 5' DNA nuclease
MADEQDRPGPGPEPRQTLAMRLAERQRQRALRAERLARLRSAPPAAPDGRADVGPGAGIAPVEVGTDGEADAEAALEEFLRALTGGVPAPAPAPAPEPGAILHFQRPERPPAAAAPGDLDRLPGAGPGLVWALERAGIHCLADLAPLAPEELVARLGPIGRLVPAEAWLETARTPPA